MEARCAQTGTTDPGLQLQALVAMLRPMPVAPVEEEENSEVDPSKLHELNDADLLRYQVSLDRQLSKCMGELLQMIAMRPTAALQ